MKKETALVICAHSDDQVFGAGGTIARYAREGKTVKTIIFSYGEQSHPWLDRKVVVQTRTKEAFDADKVLGGHGVLFYGLLEGKFAEEAKEKKTVQKLIQLLHKLKPQKIFTHSEDDPHPDHKATAALVLEAFDKAKIQGEVYTFDVWSPVKVKERHHPKYIVPIKDTFKIKLKALRCFSSQWAAMIMLLWSVYARALINGLQHGHLLAEKFHKVR